MPKAVVRLFGTFEFLVDSQPIDLHSAQARFVAYLALARGRAVPRPAAWSALWPELSDDRARSNLSNIIWRLRRTLVRHGVSASALRVDLSSVAIDSTLVQSDVGVFLQCTFPQDGQYASHETLARAVGALELYRGDLLADWDVEWCIPERTLLRQRCVDTLQCLSVAFEKRGRIDLALRYAREAMEKDPLNEELARQLMRLLTRSGNRTSALAFYRRFAANLHAELGVMPDDGTQALAATLARRQTVSVGPRESDLVESLLSVVAVIGRENEKLLIASTMESAIAGTGGGILLVGEPGIGKSRLVEWAVEDWVARGGTVFSARCLEFAEPIPYQVLFDAVGKQLARPLLPSAVGVALVEPTPLVGSSGGVPQEVESQERPFQKLRLLDWFRASLWAAAEEKPLLVALEDLQWADADSLDAIVYLLAHAKSAPIVLLLTARWQATPSIELNLDRLHRYALHTIRLRRLSELETRTLVEQLLGGRAVPPAFATWIHAETEGNPLFVVETLRLLRQKGDLGAFLAGRTPGPLAPGTVKALVPEGIRLSIQQRLQFLDKESLRIAHIASTAGRSVDPHLLAAVSRVPGPELSQSLHVLMQVGILERDEDDRLRFSHDKIRAVCYESVPAAQLRVYHAQWAEALAQGQGASPQDIAWHWQSAGQWAEAMVHWEFAGDEAMRLHAYDAAVRSYQLGLQCLRRLRVDSRDERCRLRAKLLLKCECAMAHLGMPDERRAVLKEARLAITRGQLWALGPSWYLRKGLLEEHVGDFVIAAKFARRSWAMARALGNREVETEALRLMAIALGRGGREKRARAVSMLALRKAGNDPTRLRVAALTDAAIVHLRLGEYERALAYIREARVAIIELGDDDGYLVSLTEAAIQKRVGEVESARLNCLRALRESDARSEAVSRARTRFQLATLDALEGRLADSLTNLRYARSTLRSAGYSRMYAACLNEIAYGVGRLLGNYHWAWFASERALELSRAYRSAHATAIYLDTQAQLLLEMDRVDEAQKVIDEAIALLGEDLTSTGQFAESLARRGMVYLRAGNLPRAIEDLEAARRAQTQRGERLHLPDTLTSLAMAYALLGDADRAVEASTEALRVLAAVRGVNHQPQRILWNHYKILARFDRQPRLHFLRRAVRSIEAQAARLTPAQAHRFRTRVPVNREILEAWAELHGAAAAGAEPSPVDVSVPPAGLEGPSPPVAAVDPEGRPSPPVAAPTPFETPEPPAPSLRVS